MDKHGSHKPVPDPGEGPGPPNPHSAPLFLDQTETQMAEKNFFETGLPFSQDLDDSPPYLEVWIRHCKPFGLLG